MRGFCNFMEETIVEFVTVVIILALVEYLYFGAMAGQARVKYGVEAPATTGDPIFERTLRVQQNTLEQLVVFLPSIWFFATYVSPFIAALLGIVFIVGRFVYFTGYVAEPGKRTAGFIITFVANAILLLGGLVGAIMAWVG